MKKSTFVVVVVLALALCVPAVAFAALSPSSPMAIGSRSAAATCPNYADRNANGACDRHENGACPGYTDADGDGVCDNYQDGACSGYVDADGDGILEKDGRKFSFTMLQIATSSTQVRMMPLLKESFAAAGIDMKIQNVEWSVYLQRLNERTYDACCLAWTSPFDPDPYQVWHSSQADAPTGSNHIGYKNPELDKLIEELRGTFDM